MPALALWWRRGHRPARRLRGDDTAYLLACVVGLVGTSWAARLHEGGYANVSMPAQAGAAVVVGCLLGWFLRSARLTGAVVTGLALAFVAQAGVMAAYQPTVLPTAADRAAGDRFVATLQRLPGRVLVPTHPYYLRLAGLPTHASAIAIYDIYRSGGGPELLSGVLPWDLDGVSAVVLDNTSDVAMFGDPLTRRVHPGHGHAPAARGLRAAQRPPRASDGALRAHLGAVAPAGADALTSPGPQGVSPPASPGRRTGSRLRGP